MRIPQELVDAIIDCIGADRTGEFVVGRLFQSVVSKSERAELKTLALVSRACNHRARSHLFARCNIVNSDFDAFERFGQCPDTLLKYTRALIIRYSENPTRILATLRRFTSSPLVSIRFHSIRIPEEVPELLKSLFPSVRCVAVVASTVSAATALNLISILEHMSELRLQWCRFTDLEGDEGPPTLLPLRGRLVLLEPYPHFATTSLLSRTPLPLNSLCYKPKGLPSENKLIDACAGSLETLEVRMAASLADPSFTLDLSSCVNLRRIILSITVGYGGGAIAALSRLLSTLREHKLSNIRLVADNPQVYDLPALVESWERLDQVLNKLGGQARGRGETLIFQIASIVAFTKQAIAALLPRFNETGVCEGVTL